MYPAMKKRSFVAIFDFLPLRRRLKRQEMLTFR